MWYFRRGCDIFSCDIFEGDVTFSHVIFLKGMWHFLMWYFRRGCDIFSYDIFKGDVIFSHVIFSKGMWHFLIWYFQRGWDIFSCDIFKGDVTFSHAIFSKGMGYFLMWYFQSVCVFSKKICIFKGDVIFSCGVPDCWRRLGSIITLKLLVANLANTNWCKNPEKWLKPWQMGTHLRVLRESFLMSTNMTGFGWFSKTFASVCFGRKWP